MLQPRQKLPQMCRNSWKIYRLQNEITYVLFRTEDIDKHPTECNCTNIVDFHRPIIIKIISHLREFLAPSSFLDLQLCVACICVEMACIKATLAVSDSILCILKKCQCLA